MPTFPEIIVSFLDHYIAAPSYFISNEILEDSLKCIDICILLVFLWMKIGLNKVYLAVMSVKQSMESDSQNSCYVLI